MSRTQIFWDRTELAIYYSRLEHELKKKKILKDYNVLI